VEVGEPLVEKWGQGQLMKMVQGRSIGFAISVEFRDGHAPDPQSDISKDHA
jgi:hypothetical protein